MSPKNGPDGRCGTRIGFTDFLEVLNHIDGQSHVPANSPCPSTNVFIIRKRSVLTSASFESYKPLRQVRTKVRIWRVLLELAMAPTGIAQAADETGSKGIVVFLAQSPSRGFASDYAIIHSLLLWLTELAGRCWPGRGGGLSSQPGLIRTGPISLHSIRPKWPDFGYIPQSIQVDNGYSYPILFLSVSGLTRGHIAD